LQQKKNKKKTEKTEVKIKKKICVELRHPLLKIDEENHFKNIHTPTSDSVP
jgi:hypothetical protein